MMTWQDPVALGLAAALVGAALWFRHWTIQRGVSSHCTQCTVGKDDAPEKTQKPTVIDVSQLRIGRKGRS